MRSNPLSPLQLALLQHIASNATQTEAAIYAAGFDGRTMRSLAKRGLIAVTMPGAWGLTLAGEMALADAPTFQHTPDAIAFRAELIEEFCSWNGAKHPDDVMYEPCGAGAIRASTGEVYLVTVRQLCEQTSPRLMDAPGYEYPSCPRCRGQLSASERRGELCAVCQEREDIREGRKEAPPKPPQQGRLTLNMLSHYAERILPVLSSDAQHAGEIARALGIPRSPALYQGLAHLVKQGLAIEHHRTWRLSPSKAAGETRREE